MTFLSKALDFIFPIVKCLSCGREIRLENGLCADCITDLNTLKEGFTPKPGIIIGYAYDGAAKNLVINLKFNNNRPAAIPLARRMLDVVDFSGIDAIVPVPIHKRRELERGFNQSDVLCREISRLSGVPMTEKGLLTRVRRTRAQTELNHAERIENVRGAFEAKDVSGARVLLVDDVYTTGATSGECAAALMKAGCKGVMIACCTMALPDS